jgi:hypothetical protein
MNFRLLWAPIPLLVSTVVLGFSQEPVGNEKSAAKAPIPLYVTPYYNFDGLKISVGEHSKELASADANTIVQVANTLKKEKDKVRAEVMYVAAIRLYDVGKKDESVYWFYTAQYRGRVFSAILDKEKIGSIGAEAFELKQAYNSFNELAGIYINGYAFGDLAKLEKTLTKVVEEGKAIPKYGEIYPAIKFIPEEMWAEKNKEVSAGLSTLIERIKNNADFIKEQRKKNGVEGKY